MDIYLYIFSIPPKKNQYNTALRAIKNGSCDITNSYLHIDLDVNTIAEDIVDLKEILSDSHWFSIRYQLKFEF